ncbi:alpha-2-macroglobulin-like [Nelusetta ayraudi]|uniref:alpha-2-macroglobulin-like n=1 Tax=Nelusetta ayraudi TaxID=303726 RepID=UPI003F72CDAD
MGRPGFQTWTLFVLFSWVHVAQVGAGPFYWVLCPAVLESGEPTKVCMSLIKPNETVAVTVTLTSKEQNLTVLSGTTTAADIHICKEFQVPSVVKEDVRNLEVEVRGMNFHSKEIRKVMLRVYKPATFVQTDKPIYLPGQTVHFRVVSIDSKMRSSNRLYELIELVDANGNRVGQWLNQTSGKILQLLYALNSECAEGTYKINVVVDGDTITHTFKVEKYVLPKFEVTIEAKDEVNIVQDSFEAKVCAKYTFGQPVPGNAKISVCRTLSRYIYHFARPVLENGDNLPEITAPCHKETKQTDLSGCATFTMEMSTFTKLDNKVLQDRLEFKAVVEEEGTGISLSQTKSAQISYEVGRLTFVDTPTIYKEGENVIVKVKAVYYNDTPIADMKLHLFKGQTWSKDLFENATTDSQGIAVFSICTVDEEPTINLGVSTSPTREYPGYRTPHIQGAEHTLSLAQDATPESKTSSTFEFKDKDKPLPCSSKADIVFKYTIVGETRGQLELYYYILSKGVIKGRGRKYIYIGDESVTEGEVSIQIDVSAKLAPFVQILIFAVLPSETVIAKSTGFDTEKCFSHQVGLQFSPPSAVPGEEVVMQVTADAMSLCGVSAIDKSVLLQEPGKTLNADTIFDLLPVSKVNYVPYEIQDPHPCLPVRAKRYIMPPPFPGDTEDAFTAFQNVGLKIATNLFVRLPSCLLFKGRTYHHGPSNVLVLYLPYSVQYEAMPSVHRMQQSGVAGAAGFDSAQPIIETVRTFFPETWIWELVEVGFSGSTDLTVKVPDTITTWETEAFCLSDQGFGLAPRQEITVFQPFFLELTLPYSMVRGERFELKATVFNYLSSCIMVSVTPLPSSDYTLTPIFGNKYGPSCLCANERRTVSWMMSPTGLGAVDVSISAQAETTDISCNNEIVTVPQRGRIDLVKKPLIVKAEGTEMTENFNWLLSPKGGVLEETFVFQLPANVIPGSSRGSISVLGDIMGRAMKNVDNLLRMPYGCGEQNMALLAPNIYILQYLKNTDQLTPAIKEKSDKFLTSGYQRQLNYKHDSGAFSTFGSGPGNTWLTAFVLRSFVQAQSFIYIEPRVIRESKTWLESLQNRDGCFQKVGKLFHNRMKGGVSDEVTLTAYITASFLEMNSSVDDAVVKKSLSCLKASLTGNRIATLGNTYTTALMAYVFTLAGDIQTRKTLLDHLNIVAVREGGFLHWNQKSAETSASLSVEISAYVMLAFLSRSPPTMEELGQASSIVRWLTRQQNHYGGFSSTQDTVVALQALALYATLLFEKGGATTVFVSSPEGLLRFEVNQANKLLYQEKELRNVVGTYNIQAMGTASAAVQLSVRYNVPTQVDADIFNIQVRPIAACLDMAPRPRMNLIITVMYNGTKDVSNMVIVKINMLSGFVPDAESLKRLKGLPSMARVDEKPGHVELYIEVLVKGLEMEFELEIVQELAVQDLKPALVEIYDYYQTSDRAEREYLYPCVARSPMNIKQ